MAQCVLVTGKRDSGRWGTAHPSVVPYQAFKTADGNVLFGVLCEGLGHPEWAKDKRFLTNSQRVKNRVVLEEMIEGIMVTNTTDEWLQKYDNTGLLYAKVNDLLDTVNHPHVLARNIITEVKHPSCGPLKLISPPVKFSRSRPSIRSPPPTLGQHTDEALQENLGLGSDEISALRRDGIVS